MGERDTEAPLRVTSIGQREIPEGGDNLFSGFVVFYAKLLESLA